jgi:hypothetical protein
MALALFYISKCRGLSCGRSYLSQVFFSVSETEKIFSRYRFEGSDHVVRRKVTDREEYAKELEALSSKQTDLT